MEWNDVRAVGESKSVSRYSEFEPALCDPAVFSFRVVTDEPLGDLCLQCTRVQLGGCQELVYDELECNESHYPHLMIVFPLMTSDRTNHYCAGR